MPPEWFGPAVTAALVSAIATIVGWILGHRTAVRIENLRREERVFDFQSAVLAEIESNLDRFGNIDLSDHRKIMVERITSTPDFTPFVPRYASTLVFDSIVAQIHILPTETVSDVVSYYKEEYKLVMLVEDLRGERYAGLDPGRKAEIYGDYIDLIGITRLKGETAASLLASSLRSSDRFTSSDRIRAWDRA